MSIVIVHGVAHRTRTPIAGMGPVQAHSDDPRRPRALRKPGGRVTRGLEAVR